MTGKVDDQVDQQQQDWVLNQCRGFSSHVAESMLVDATFLDL